MRAEELAARHPRLYHMAEAGSWDKIRELGLRDVAHLVLRVERRRGGGLGKVVWKR